MRRTTIQTTEMHKVVQERDYLLDSELLLLIEAAGKTGRHGKRDQVLIQMAYMHGLRVQEICDLQWHQVDFKTATLHVQRVKNGNDSMQPIKGEVLRALRAMKKESESPFVFVSERGDQMRRDNILKMVKRAGEVAELEVSVHPHMLRHSCGYNLANKQQDTRAIQDYLGHKNIQNTVRYTRLAKDRFKGFDRLF